MHCVCAHMCLWDCFELHARTNGCVSIFEENVLLYVCILRAFCFILIESWLTKICWHVCAFAWTYLSSSHLWMQTQARTCGLLTSLPLTEAPRTWAQAECLSFRPPGHHGVSDCGWDMCWCDMFKFMFMSVHACHKPSSQHGTPCVYTWPNLSPSALW